MRRDNNLFSEYKEIFKEYLDLDIIEKVVDSTKPIDKPVYYLPHRAVFRKDSVTTKTRIVFDASSHDVGQLSLNDCLWPGINLNPNIFHLLVNFRLNKIGILADVEKAFLQILLSERDRDAVRFLFMDVAAEPTNKMPVNFKALVYRFKCLLFGLNASPFLLAATIKRHIRKFKDKYPETFEILNSCLYVDDLVSGADNVEEALKISREAKIIMNEAHFNLRKWLTNDQLLIRRWKEEGFEIYPFNKTHTIINTLKVLGVSWDVEQDFISINVSSIIEFLREKRDTKRFVLQTSGRIYDPTGIITPFTIRLKCMFQDLWIRKLSWDDELPIDIRERWTQWCSELPQLNQIRVPRFVFLLTNSNNVQIHCFADASQKAYGAVVYLRVQDYDQVSINLIASKTRVAPVKRITLPRLELLGALVAARLGAEVKKVIDCKHASEIYYWTDSKVALCWIKGSSRKWKSFVANRVDEIQRLSEREKWFHCEGKNNPADLLSRGISADLLVNNSKWFTGPEFLKDPELSSSYLQSVRSEGDFLSESDSYLSELKCSEEKNNCIVTSLLTTESSSFFDDLLELSNDYYKILHIFSFIRRFIYNCRNTEKRRGPLTIEEVKESENILIRAAQISLGSKKALTGDLLTLHPFIDENGVVRVGGRLKKASVSYEQKFPCILPKNSRLAKIYFSTIHMRLLHVGPQGLLNSVRLKFWPLGGRNLARKTVHSCVICFKAKPIPCSQIMGELPYERVNETPAFNWVGLDLCGPFFVTYKNQRKGSLNKIFICVCTCFVTRAIHLELLSDLTSEALIAALKRFIARRGKCTKIFTDNAGNFVGAKSKLKQFYKLVNFPDEILANYLISENVDWKFIPPKSPHFGGLWEAGVKSVKHHLKRAIGDLRFSYEEFETIVIQVEGILNSRPLTPLSNDFDDFEVLTPGHFLIGRPINAVPEPLLIDVKINRLSRWQKTTRVVQTIWKKWRLVYLSTLQQRSKWIIEKYNLSVGLMVLVKEEFLPLCKWALGRISKIYTGSDGKVRVVMVRTKAGELKRSITKIAVLPIDV